MKCYKRTLSKDSKVVCKIYGYKNLSPVNEVRKCRFTPKYEKGKKSLNLCMLPLCQGNLNLHMRRANYVATIFNFAMLKMDLDSSSTMVGMRIL